MLKVSELLTRSQLIINTWLVPLIDICVFPTNEHCLHINVFTSALVASNGTRAHTHTRKYEQVRASVVYSA